jgi:hypothetical protein
MLDLGPVAAMPEHVELGFVDKMEQFQGILQRDNPVFPSMDNEEPRPEG